MVVVVAESSTQYELEMDSDEAASAQRQYIG
jgi:hypothetical protein